MKNILSTQALKFDILNVFKEKKARGAGCLHTCVRAQLKKTITLNAMQKDVLVGTLLGDACIPSKRLRVQFAQTIARENYIWHLYEIFKDFVGTPPRVENTRGGGARDRQCIRFQTYSHPDLKFYDDLFYTAHEYKGRKKRVPENIGELLTARSLAYWFMDDGYRMSKKYKNRTYINYIFSTHSFPFEDQSILVQALRNNFSIHANIQKEVSYYKLYIRSKSTNRFVNLISPYIHPCFYYKIQ